MAFMRLRRVLKSGTKSRNAGKCSTSSVSTWHAVLATTAAMRGFRSRIAISPNSTFSSCEAASSTASSSVPLHTTTMPCSMMKTLLPGSPSEKMRAPASYCSRQKRGTTSFICFELRSANSSISRSSDSTKDSKIRCATLPAPSCRILSWLELILSSSESSDAVTCDDRGLLVRTSTPSSANFETGSPLHRITFFVSSPCV
mmetsp:Transcript_27846/g.68801  ORF Transcript_27846/g.68801 Transcript_27846/m.68801 type:complete len:201 (+) Transcript_27846:374-976(+)